MNPVARNAADPRVPDAPGACKPLAGRRGGPNGSRPACHPPHQPPVAVVTTAPTAERTLAPVREPSSTGLRFDSRSYVAGTVPKNPPSGILVEIRDPAPGVRGGTDIGTGVTTHSEPPTGELVRESPAAGRGVYLFHFSKILTQHPPGSRGWAHERIDAAIPRHYHSRARATGSGMR